jgi:hypothetical protein
MAQRIHGKRGKTGKNGGKHGKHGKPQSYKIKRVT